MATISNPQGLERNTITVGKIYSKEPVPFGDKAGETQYNVIEHTAEVYQGSSGSALINEDLEIVGINLGASEDAFHHFLRGKAMPCDSILDFINDMENSISS